MNPLMQKMGGAAQAMGGVNPQMLQQVKQAMNALRGLKNPQLNAVMQMIGNRNPQEVFAEQCKQHGMDPDEAMRQIQQMLS